MNVDQIIDKRTVAIPGPIGQVTPSMQQLHDEARTYAANTKALQDLPLIHISDPTRLRRISYAAFGLS